MDLYGRTILGFSMAEHIKKSLVIEVLNQAIGRTGAKGELLVHSDRGVQYASKEYPAILNKNKFICSMSRRGNCYDKNRFGASSNRSGCMAGDLRRGPRPRQPYLNISKYFTTGVAYIQATATEYQCKS
ncbi:mobile element protein [Desulfocucumis palustris]|uniref:Mobile element protein n=1 Tax=Desulfocucumis palustris TaxID=1898651 RepID=A0A2L2X7A8_9FIRM|nr:mobile element protein [Desulfocucumis palustris]